MYLVTTCGIVPGVWVKADGMTVTLVSCMDEMNEMNI